MIGCASGAAGLYSLQDRDNEAVTEQVTVKRLSGAEIVHRDFRTTDNSLVFTTEAKGAGTSETSVPKRAVPEARAWMDYRHGIQPIAGYEYGTSGSGPVIGGMYLYRWGRFSAGAGLLASGERISALVSAVWWF